MRGPVVPALGVVAVLHDMSECVDLVVTAADERAAAMAAVRQCERGWVIVRRYYAEGRATLHDTITAEKIVRRAVAVARLAGEVAA